MIVDAHVHVKGGDRYRREFRPELILHTMDEAGVDISCIFSICLPSRASNRLTMDCYHAAPDRFMPFAHVVPKEGRGAVDELKRCLHEDGARGLKLHRGEMVEPWFDPLPPILEVCVGEGCPVLFDFGLNLELAYRIVESFPELKLIIAHIGAPADEELNELFIVLAESAPNVWLDASYVSSPWMIPEAIERLGAGRVIFGSDGPLIHPSIELAKIAVCRLPEEDYRKVTAENILGLLRPV